MTVIDLDTYRERVQGAHLVPPRPDGGLPPARRAADLPDPPPIAWLIDEVWPAGELGLLVGDGGAFKSSVAIHMACAVAGGHRLFDEFQCLPRPALIISAEDHRDVVLMRAKAFCRGHGWDLTKTLGNLYLLAEHGPTLGEREWTQHIQAEVERIRPGIIILDPWAEVMGGDENSNTDARPVIKYLRHVASRVGAAVVVVHHAGKAKEGGRSLDRIRGASALPSAARVIWFFDFGEAGLTVDNLKHSRAPRLGQFRLDRHIETLPGNRAEWVSARVCRHHIEDPMVAKVLAALDASAHGELSFNTLHGEVGGRKAGLHLVLQQMVRSGRLELLHGARNATIYRRPAPTGSDQFPLVPEGSGTSRGSSAPAPTDLVPPHPTPPLGGVGVGTSRGGGAARPVPPAGLGPAGLAHREPVEPLDPREPVTAAELLDRLEERRGMSRDE